MNPIVEFNLTLILFLPWFLILGVLFWCYPRQPRHAARRGYDLVVLVLSALASWWRCAGACSMPIRTQARSGSRSLACLTAYGAFLAVLTLAWFARPFVVAWLNVRRLRPRRDRTPSVIRSRKPQ
jgi:hypothetical protein